MPSPVLTTRAPLRASLPTAQAQSVLVSTLPSRPRASVKTMLKLCAILLLFSNVAGQFAPTDALNCMQGPTAECCVIVKDGIAAYGLNFAPAPDSTGVDGVCMGASLGLRDALNQCKTGAVDPAAPTCTAAERSCHDDLTDWGTHIANFGTITTCAALSDEFGTFCPKTVPCFTPPSTPPPAAPPTPPSAPPPSAPISNALGLSPEVAEQVATVSAVTAISANAITVGVDVATNAASNAVIEKVTEKAFEQIQEKIQKKAMDKAASQAIKGDLKKMKIRTMLAQVGRMEPRPHDTFCLSHTHSIVTPYHCIPLLPSLA